MYMWGHYPYGYPGSYVQGMDEEPANDFADVQQARNVEFRSGTVTFERHVGSGPHRKTVDVYFDRPVTEAVAVLSGTQFGFSPREDHELGRVNLRLTSQVRGNRVRVTATFGVRDWSKEWDDAYQGNVHFAVIAKTR